MKTKILALALLAGSAAFAETHFSFSIGSYRPGYYAPPPVYYAPVRPERFYSPRADWRRFRDRERFIYQDRDFRNRQPQGQWQRQDQWQDRNDYRDSGRYDYRR